MTVYKMCKHLHVVQSIEPLLGGGLGQAALALHLAMHEATGKSHLMTTAVDDVPNPTTGVQQFARSGPDWLFYSPVLNQRANDLLERHAVLHGHGFYTMINAIVVRNALTRGRHLLYHVHGMFSPWALHHAWLKKQVVRWLFEDWNFRHAGLWRALTITEADQIRGQGFAGPIVVAPNGIEVSLYAAGTRCKFSDYRRRLVFLGRLHPVKGLENVIAACASNCTFRHEWEFVVIGPDEDGYRGTLEALVRASGLGESIRFVGTATGHDKIALLQSADVFVMPSFTEGFSVAILEAMACGKPVLASHACNFPELESEGGGWLCDPTAESVSSALQQVLECSDQELQQRGALARRLVEAKYTWPTITKTILDACDDTFGKG